MAGNRRRTGVAVILGLAILAGVFSLYARPDFLVQIGNQIWACF
jgi:hypothetical protein